MPEAVLLLAALAAAPLSPSAQSPAQLSADLVARSVTAIEQLSPAEHHNHGHAVDAAQTKVACVVELMGFAPADAKRAADVTTAYTYFLCAAGAPGQPYQMSAHISGPAAVDLRQQPPLVHVPEAGAGYDQRLKAIIPVQYQDWAVKGFRDRAIPAGLIPKYNALLGVAPSP
ncbi:hypothetical protein GCM10009682_50460 [Luedemannella flava]|uniref:Uncharacterized protein n=1 Tax=Luedemannella flava TaxID=349316 RepID=A0ABN2MES2_9ACTN